MNKTKVSVLTEQRSPEEVQRKLRGLEEEADRVRTNDRVLIEGLLTNFYGKKLDVGVGFKRAFGSILSGDYFELFPLPDNNYMFVFADISGHGLPAYTTLIRLRSAIALALSKMQKKFQVSGILVPLELIKDISEKFFEIMDRAHSKDFASILFTFIYNDNDKFHLNFFSQGMHFPLVVRNFNNNLLDIYDLNLHDKGWEPKSGLLWGREMRKILGSQYDNYPSCHFTIYEGDRILYFSDGIIDAFKIDQGYQTFGMQNLKELLRQKQNKSPQLVINEIYQEVFRFIKEPRMQEDDMTAVLIDFPPVRHQ